MSMQGVFTYRIEVRDPVDEGELNSISPLKMAVVRANEAVTVLTICSDQAGLIGVIRHLHRRGFILLSITCER